jgi:hypothetical protein
VTVAFGHFFLSRLTRLSSDARVLRRSHAVIAWQPFWFVFLFTEAAILSFLLLFNAPPSCLGVEAFLSLLSVSCSQVLLAGCATQHSFLVFGG